MLLYIHVPFCRSKCGYCAFHSLPVAAAGAEGMQRYLDALLREIALWGDRLGNVPVQTIFFGGGTPSLLPEKAVAVIMERLRKAFSIDVGAEISFEANPESVASYGYLDTLFKCGINRLSMGVQSMNNDNLHVLDRPHKVRDAIQAFYAARQAGFANINLDLIWGLPGQRLKLWLDELKAITDLKPDHLSCYGLTLEEGTPLEQACLKGRFELPDEQEQARMFIYGAEYLESRGYMQYEISNFARMGFQCRHNLGYWEGADYLGFGPSAVSTLYGRRWENPHDLKEYANRTTQGTIAHDAESLSPLERAEELIMLRLRTSRGLRVKAYRDLTGRDFLKEHKMLIHALHRNKLVRIRDGYLRLTRNGMLVSNTILENIFDALPDELPTVLPDELAGQPAAPLSATASEGQPQEPLVASVQADFQNQSVDNTDRQATHAVKASTKGQSDTKT
ncbi:radical SAM family heme chaperone HemW [Oleidesulfovibrio sp.]|uniref:radical SAM family heme chaperone HemW n=1 Tax=Oleidesulfovibrio sp. TaxID=2909707 RepID=UPI003A898450